MHLQRYEQTMFVIFGECESLNRLFATITSPYSLYDEAHVWFSSLDPTCLIFHDVGLHLRNVLYKLIYEESQQ